MPNSVSEYSTVFGGSETNSRRKISPSDSISHKDFVNIMMSGVSDKERDFIEKLVRYGQGAKILPFYFMGWVVCTANFH